MANESSDYLLGTSDEELARLGYQHQVWLDEAVWLWEQAGFGLGSEILDVGCGPGFATLDLARLVGSEGKIVGVDASEKFIGHLQRQIEAAGLQNVTAEIGDVHALDFAENSFDGAFARWLLCFVENPEAVVANVSRLLRPGGAFVVKDYFNYLSVKVYPEKESIVRLFEANHKSVRLHGGSYDIAGLLPEICARHGFDIKIIKPITRAARVNSRTWNWATMFLRSFVPKLVENEILTQNEINEFWRDWDELSANPSAFFYTPPMLGIIGVKK
jgi:SAM-dependent methyltransferase